jgi:hypothetical protein
MVNGMLKRRRIPRTLIFATAKVMARHASRPHGCVVHNISSLGARLEFPTTTEIPSIFELTFDASQTLRVCHVVWRTMTEVGVEFSNPQFA